MPEILHLPKSATADEIVTAVHAKGAVIIDGLMPQTLADQVFAETEAYMAHSPLGEASFTGALTTRTGALVARSPACRQLITQPLVLQAVEAFLAPYCERVQLHLTQLIRLGPGQPSQVLHRDRQAWGNAIPRQIEPQLNMIWALTDFTTENGATRVVPGSQEWPYERKAEPHEIVQATMARGSVLVYSGSVIHGGGENRSDADRIGINLTYSLGWLRQEENQYLSCPPALARDLAPELQELLGYTMGSTACGYFSEPVAPGQGRELCPPEQALGRSPRPERRMGIVDQGK